MSPTIKSLIRENRKLQRQLDNQTATEELVLARIDELFQSKTSIRVPSPGKARPRSKHAPIGVLHFTDQQIGKVTKSYNTAVAAARTTELARETVSCLKGHHEKQGINEIHVYLGGDTVEGETIFAGQAWVVDSNVLDQAVKNAPAMIVGMLLYFLEHFETVKVFAVSGNHGRSGLKGGNQSPATNWDTVAYFVAKLLLEKTDPLAAKRCTWDIAEDFYCLDTVFPGHSNLIVHGDQIQGGGSGGLPMLGIQKKIVGWQQLLPHFSSLYVGHFHQFASGFWNNVAWYLGGTLESDNEWARRDLAAGGRPMQRLQIWAAKYGAVVDLPIRLT